MFATIDEMSDDPVTVTTDGNRIRVRYGRGVALSLDHGEAVALSLQLVSLLGGMGAHITFADQSRNGQGNGGDRQA
ncbi:hypothetical protein QMK17_13045 [Rhodococcus sp. G-MC3]|uniref:hypothetical protein n=1 Tax=Rhodococcus sp. G-MC3 TaxID=3046209 RepID=UPI0024B8E7A7|nr:hypothetical protein [Rhodococcus sp. G-MC3]MDJ0394253.1 hypothetical protein [Rhodococcus sp. G-MC3]